MHNKTEHFNSVTPNGTSVTIYNIWSFGDVVGYQVKAERDYREIHNENFRVMTEAGEFFNSIVKENK